MKEQIGLITVNEVTACLDDFSEIDFIVTHFSLKLDANFC